MKQRLPYFDILKGIAIFMVVMGHVLTMCVHEIDRDTLVSLGMGFAPLFVFAAVCAACIIAVTLMVEYILSKSPFLSAVLTGNITARRTKPSAAAV